MALRVIALGFGCLGLHLLRGLLNVPDNNIQVVGVFPWSLRQKKGPVWLYQRFPNLANNNPDEQQLIQTAAQRQLPTFCGHGANSPQFRQWVQALDANLILVGSWGEKISKAWLNDATVQWVNCHPGRLPEYRGPNPYTATLLNEPRLRGEGGISFHQMDNGWDTGPILAAYRFSLTANETGETLRLRCAQTAARQLPIVLSALQHNQLTPTPQDQSQAGHYPEIQLTDGLVDWSHPMVPQQLRALYPWLKGFSWLRSALGIQTLVQFWPPVETVDLPHPVPPGLLVNNSTGTLTIAYGLSKTEKSTSQALVFQQYQLYWPVFGYLPINVSRWLSTFIVRPGLSFGQKS